MKRKVLGVLFTAMCLCAVPSAAYAEAQEAETTEAAGEAADEPEAGARNGYRAVRQPVRFSGEDRG